MKIVSIGMAVAMLFLSSAAVRADTHPVEYEGQNNNPFSGASHFEITLDPEFPEEAQPPIPFLYFDVSKHLDPWEGIMALRLAIATYDYQEEAERRASERLRTADRFVWDLSGWTFFVMGLLILTFGGIAGFATLKSKGV